MHKKARIILLIIITLLLFLPVNKAYAKKLEYTCEYTKFVKASQTKTYYTIYTYNIKVYSQTDKNKKVTGVEAFNPSNNKQTYGISSTYVSNFLEDYSDKTNNKSINKYTTLNNNIYTNPTCPKYILYYNKSAFLVSDNLSELQNFSSSDTDTILENTNIKIEQTAANSDAEELCKESTFSEKSTYDKVCIYNYVNKKKDEFIYLYYNSTDSVIFEKETKNKYYSKDLAKDTKQNGNPMNGKTINKVDLSTGQCPKSIYYQTVVDWVGILGRDIQKPAAYANPKIKGKMFSSIVNTEKTYSSMLETEEGSAYIFSSSTCEPIDKLDLEIHRGDINCDELLGEKTRKQIRKILTYVKILVPILIIAMGIIDFSQAMFAGKEEEMKKAQTRFTKRLIIGVVIFLLPTLINFMLDITNDAWKRKNNDSACGLDIIEK